MDAEAKGLPDYLEYYQFSIPHAQLEWEEGQFQKGQRAEVPLPDESAVKMLE